MISDGRWPTIHPMSQGSFLIDVKSVNPSTFMSIAGRLTCFVGIASYCCVTLYMFVFSLSADELSRNPEGIYFGMLVSIWGALPFLFLWFTRRRALPFAANTVLCVAALAMTAFEIWKLIAVLPQAMNHPSAVGGVLMSMPIYLWPVSICAVALAEILFRLKAANG